jgi:hypothetical protein
MRMINRGGTAATEAAISLLSSRRKAVHPFLTPPGSIALILILLRCKLTAKGYTKKLILHATAIMLLET